MSNKSNQETHSLKAANENPWYVLMTLYDNPEQNRRIWNSWVTGALNDEERKSVGGQLGTGTLNYRDWASNREKVEPIFKAEWNQRNPNLECPPLPDPKLEIDFSETHFSEDTPFIAEGLIFSKCSFSRCSFDQKAKFRNVIFCRPVDFLLAKFAEGVDFSSTEFRSSTSFNLAKFIKSSKFADTNFSSETGVVEFNQAEFGNSEYRDELMKLHGNQFRDDLLESTNFSKTVFNCPAAFFDAKFFHKLKFKEGQFHKYVYFNRAVFSCSVLFQEWRFDEYVYFQDVKFESTVDFDDNRFEENAYFNHATFKEKCDFSKGVFNRDVRFDKAVFHHHVYFLSVTFTGRAYFLETEFGLPDSPKECRADFSDSSFQLPANFRRAIFRINYPILSGTLLHEHSFFSFDARLWPDDNRKKDKTQELNEFPDSAVSPTTLARECCAVIRNCLTKQGLTEPAHFFFRREMGFTMREATIRQQIPYRLYWILSDFGNSIWRPAAVLFIVFSIFSSVFFTLSPVACSGCPNALTHSFLNTVSLFGSVRQYYPDCSSDLRPILSTMQTMISYILLFLFALGLRQRFRLRS
ncbi:hypothetical protein F4212_15780 [Candidatus Poribacteria bacterium]|nr:hypothetical protein [Candidatus Poribacteria bacterium]